MKKRIQSITGVVLAGGKSSRMGQDKGLLQLQGRPMVAHVLSQVQACFQEVVLVANSPAYAQFGYPVLPDLVAEIGPMGGILTGLKACRTERAFFVSCDMPFISSAAIRYLLENADDAAIQLASVAGKLQPLFGLYSQTCIPLLEQHIQEKNYKLQALIRQTSHQLIPFDTMLEQQPHLFQNINTPQEYSLALDHASQWK